MRLESEVWKLDRKEALNSLSSSEEGLSDNEARKRLKK